MVHLHTIVDQLWTVLRGIPTLLWMPLLGSYPTATWARSYKSRKPFFHQELTSFHWKAKDQEGES